MAKYAMALNRPLIKADIERGYAHSRSAAEAARFLDVDYRTFKKYAKLYGIWHTNPGGKGIPRPGAYHPFSLESILQGKHPNYNHKRLKERLIRAGVLKNECALCGYDKARVDGRVPLTLYIKDGNKHNLSLENLELRCWNCYYLTAGRMDVTLDRLDTTEEDNTMGPNVLAADLAERMQLEDVKLDESDIEKLQQEALADPPHGE